MNDKTQQTSALEPSTTSNDLAFKAPAIPLEQRPFLKTKELAEYLGISVRSILRWVKEKEDFPRPLRTGKNLVIHDRLAVIAFLSQDPNTNNPTTKARQSLDLTLPCVPHPFTNEDGCKGWYGVYSPTPNDKDVIKTALGDVK